MKILVIDDGNGLAQRICAALNAAELPDDHELIALNFELSADGKVPDLIELIPPGAVITGRDGRRWTNDNPAGVIAALDERGLDLVIDFEHATELKAPQGEKAPAAGWVKRGSFEAREAGAIWGRVEWTPSGQAAIANREYRYLSPVILYEKATGRIRSLSSIGLVNKPNLFNQALNHEQRKEIRMDLKALLKALGLAETATIEQALNAIGALKTDLATALNRAETPSLDKFVPRADYDTVVARATNAEQLLKDKAKTELETAINTEIDAALKAGKITPATKDYYVAMCRQEKGLDEFRKFVAAAPVIAAASDLYGKKPPESETALNAEQKQIADLFGNSAEDLKKYGTA